MRVVFFDPQKFDTEFKGIVLKRLKAAAEEIKKEAVNECPVGTISRPIESVEKPWMARKPGTLKKSIRVVLPHSINPRFDGLLNIRIYAGHYMAWYAAIVEFKKHYMRRGKNRSMKKVKNILGVK
jgi:hypothetical protein